MSNLAGQGHIRGNGVRAITRAARSNRGRLGKLPDPYLRKRPVHKKDARVAREFAAARMADAAGGEQ